MEKAVETAYKAVMKPKEGTILTVAKGAARKAAELAETTDDAAVFQAMAREMADEIQRKNALGETTVFICPVGPVGQYPYFVDIVNGESISLKNVWFLNMDEYLTDEKQWIAKEDKLSFRGFMDRTVYSKIRPELVMPEDQRVFPDPSDPDNMARTIEKQGH